ncbi:DUF4362 domain-containing protein [Paenibacillus sp. FSL R5-0912]|uniref:DUF4362 domain-containing protein n=1 Tax=Paenibacillus sp. FSL R5-0912 TaxID=1536771 RepID=UPI0006938C55|nr:DUF4362 domain-containing protein [Paenibacillus sp. FSL R5-0912]
MKMLRVCICMLLMSLIIVACSNSMHYEAAAKKGYVVYVQGEIINYTYFEQFVENYNNGQDATVKIAKYTDEGDPIFHTLEYKRDQKKISYTYDNSEDENGDKLQANTLCSSITNVDGVYHLADCADDETGKWFSAKQPSK